jgi:hypothetical protein
MFALIFGAEHRARRRAQGGSKPGLQIGRCPRRLSLPVRRFSHTWGRGADGRLLASTPLRHNKLHTRGCLWHPSLTGQLRWHRKGRPLQGRYPDQHRPSGHTSSKADRYARRLIRGATAVRSGLPASAGQSGRCARPCCPPSMRGAASWTRAPRSCS